jgi:AcrR family transcriptional regulator
VNTDVSNIVDLSGRPLGQRALKKRRQLMDATVELLKHRSLRDLRVVDIARAVGTSPATFYQYFKDVEDVALQLAEEATDKMPSMMKIFEGDWEGERGMQKAREVVDAFIQYWDEHGSVLRVRNVAADEGNARFLAVRSKATAPMLAAMTAQMERRSAENHKGLAETKSKNKIKPLAAAVAMGAILDRLSAYRKELEALGLTRADIVETSAQILHKTLSS